MIADHATARLEEFGELETESPSYRPRVFSMQCVLAVYVLPLRRALSSWRLDRGWIVDSGFGRAAL